jgi:hypothetical protein
MKPSGASPSWTGSTATAPGSSKIRVWWVATHKENGAPAETQKRVQQMFGSGQSAT